MLRPYFCKRFIVLKGHGFFAGGDKTESLFGRQILAASLHTVVLQIIFAKGSNTSVG